MTTVWVLGDQLTRRGPVSRALDGDADRVLMVESREFAARHPYHGQKLALVFSAMRHFRDRLREDGVTVRYERADSFRDGLEAFFDDHPEESLVAMRPAGGGADALRDCVTEIGGSVEFVQNETFLCSPDAFQKWDDADLSHEEFYRWMRRRTGYLMDDGDPIGGQWNYDERNRETPPDDYEVPPPVRFPPDDTTERVIAEVSEEYDAWGDVEAFDWPVTREDAQEALEDFCENRLADFGTYQDAIVAGEWALTHSLLSPALNLGLLHPLEVVERAIEEYETREDVPLHCVEGFVRQILGWREFVRQVYRREDGLADANQLDHDRDLPAFYWTGDTDMACLGASIDHVREHGYAHHIERLMLQSNFALTFGVDPAELNAWFQAAYVDAYHWVTTPNVVGMGVYGTDAFTTKPYAASANYVNEMSDHCAGCPYDPDATTGADACPFNALYWDFLARHEDRLRHNYRMAGLYHHVDNKRGEELDAIRERADDVRTLAAEGEL